MDIDKVDAEVLYCNVTGGAEFYNLDPDACLAAFQAFNSAAIEFASVAPDRLIPVYILPLHDIEEATKELQRIVNEGARARSSCPSTPPTATSRRIGTTCTTRCGRRSRTRARRSASTWAATTTSSTSCAATRRRRRASSSRCRRCSWRRSSRAPSCRRVRAAPAPQGRAGGGRARVDPVLRRPARQDGGAPWVGPARHEPPRAAEPLLAPEHVRELRGGRVRDQVRHDLGVENLLWATDYPHPDSTWPHSQEVIQRALPRRARGRDATHRRRQRRPHLQPVAVLALSVRRYDSRLTPKP